MSHTIEIHSGLSYIGLSKTACKNNNSVRKNCISEIGYLNKTLHFRLNVAFSNCHNPLPKDAIEIWGFSVKVIWTFSKGCILFSDNNI